jgi:hypothetical protein
VAGGAAQGEFCLRSATGEQIQLAGSRSGTGTGIKPGGQGIESGLEQRQAAVG